MQSGLYLHMWFILATNVDLNENDDEKYIYIISFLVASQNVVVFTT